VRAADEDFDIKNVTEAWTPKQPESFNDQNWRGMEHIFITEPPV
jgi:hypothetical protein